MLIHSALDSMLCYIKFVSLSVINTAMGQTGCYFFLRVTYVGPQGKLLDVVNISQEPHGSHAGSLPFSPLGSLASQGDGHCPQHLCQWVVNQKTPGTMGTLKYASVKGIVCVYFKWGHIKYISIVVLFPAIITDQSSLSLEK